MNRAYLFQITVESNDALYGSDQKFLDEIDKICTILLGEIKGSLNKNPVSRNQYTVALELFTTIAVRGDLNHMEMQTLALDIWEILLRNGQSDRYSLVRNTFNYVDTFIELICFSSRPKHI